MGNSYSLSLNHCRSSFRVERFGSIRFHENVTFLKHFFFVEEDVGVLGCLIAGGINFAMNIVSRLKHFVLVPCGHKLNDFLFCLVLVLFV